jgi:hypothetical protein
MNGAMVLNMARAHLQRFVSFPSDAALDLAVCWAAHTHCVGPDERLAFDSTPRLMFLSDKRGSGKSQAMARVLGLSFHPRLVIDPTPLSYATMVNQARPTMAVDEADCLFGNGASKQQLRGLLNAGYTPGAEFIRGKDAPIDTFCPLIIAGLGARIRVAAELEPLRSRSIIVEMQPGIPPDPYERRDHDAITAMYRDQLTTWARRNLRAILAARPEMPTGIEMRLREVCHPLFAVADVAGGRWPEAVRDAARQLLLGEFNDSESGELSMFERLLTDLRTVYGPDAGKMSTHDIVDGLYELPGDTWGKLWPNKNKAPKELAAMLRPLGVEPTMLWLDGEPIRGYHREGLANLWDEIVSDADVSLAVRNDVRIDLDDETIDA